MSNPSSPPILGGIIWLTAVLHVFAGSPGLVRALLEGFRFAPSDLEERSSDMLTIFAEKVCSMHTRH